MNDTIQNFVESTHPKEFKNKKWGCILLDKKYFLGGETEELIKQQVPHGELVVLEDGTRYWFWLGHD